MDIQQHVANTFMASHPEDAARVLEQLSPEATAAALELSPPPLAAGVLDRMSLNYAARCLDHTTPAFAAQMLVHLSAEIAVLMLRRIEEGRRNSILAGMASKHGEKLRRNLKYPRGTAGALTDFDVFALLDEVTVQDVIEEARTGAQRVTRYLYAINRDKKLSGVLNMRELFLAPPKKRVSSIMNTHVEKLFVYTDLQSISSHPGWTHYYALPVVEEDDLFLGALRYKTLLRLQLEKSNLRPSSQLSTAGSALGELYQVGLYGLLQSAVPRREPGKNP